MPLSLSGRKVPGVPFSPGQQVKPGILRCQEPDFESLWVVIPPMAGFLAHDSDRHPAYARFVWFYPAGTAGEGPAWRLLLQSGRELTPALGLEACITHKPMALYVNGLVNRLRRDSLRRGRWAGPEATSCCRSIEVNAVTRDCPRRGDARRMAHNPEVAGSNPHPTPLPKSAEASSDHGRGL
jgi:hypothetical protein